MITTHVLNLNTGQPAIGVSVTLEKRENEQWTLLKELETNDDGRIDFSCNSEPGKFRLTFDIENYLSKNGITPFFTSAPVEFHITDTGRKYHIPLLLNSFGFSTYRGS